jgi:hypothetical protein
MSDGYYKDHLHANIARALRPLPATAVYLAQRCCVVDMSSGYT